MAMAIEARYGFNESGRSAQGIPCLENCFMETLLIMSQLLAATLEEGDPVVYEILQRVRNASNSGPSS